MFAYCGNNPVSKIDIDGEDWETIKNWAHSITEEVKAAARDTAQVVNHVFDLVVYSTKTATASVQDYLFIVIETGAMYSTSHGNNDSPIIVFKEITTAVSGAQSFDKGVAICIGEGGIKFSNGSSGASIEASANGNSFKFTTGIYKFGISFSENVDYRNHSAGRYTDVYIRPIPTAIAVAAVYYTGGAIIPIFLNMVARA